MLKKSDNQIINEPIPFYKEGNIESPAGYVIETNKEVMVCYHGTQFRKLMGSGGTEVKNDLTIVQRPMKFGEKEVNVHLGFKKEYETSKESLREALTKVDPNKEIHTSGHSLGGAVAQIAALDLSTNQNKKVSAVTTFGSPRVFSTNAAKLYSEKGLSDVTLRVKQNKDPIPRAVPKKLGYAHAGNKISLDSNIRLDGLHGGITYAKITNRITDVDMKNIKKSDIDKDNSAKVKKDYSIKGYMQAVKRTAKRLFRPIRSLTRRIRSNLTFTSKRQGNQAVVAIVRSEVSQSQKR